MQATKKTVWLIVRGICGNPDDCQEWEQRAADWIMQDAYCREQGYIARADSYRCSFLTVWLREADRARSFALVLNSYVKAGYAIRIVAHSNGTRVVREGMKRAHWPAVEEVHFVCGACDSDFRRTGFNAALHSERLSRFYYYTAGKDFAMRAENTLLGKLDFAVPEHSQPLGLKGPQHVDAFVGTRVIEGGRGWEEYGHSTAWDSRHFEHTLRRIVRHPGADVCTPPKPGALAAALQGLRR